MCQGGYSHKESRHFSNYDITSIKMGDSQLLLFFPKFFAYIYEDTCFITLSAYFSTNNLLGRSWPTTVFQLVSDTKITFECLHNIIPLVLREN